MMMMRSSCFLSLPSSTSNTKPPQVSSVKKEACWKRQCVVMGVASTIVGLEFMCDSLTLTLAHEATHVIIITNSNDDAKWSHKRTCPSWQANSLETIVPENLPRPSARRRYQAIRSSSITAPPLSAPTNNTPDCFSM